MSIVVTGDVELQQLFEDLKPEEKKGKVIMRAGLKAGAKIVGNIVKFMFPVLTGTAAGSVVIKAMKRKKGRTGLRIGLFAMSTKGKPFPYPLAVEYGAKAPHPKGFLGKRNRVSGATAGYRLQPGRYVEKAFAIASGQAMEAIRTTIIKRIEKLNNKRAKFGS